MNRKIIISTMITFAFFLTTCASTKSGSSLSIMDAIEQTAEKITGDLPKGSRVAIVAFESANDNLSDYIMEELTGALFDRKIEVADRQNLEYVYKELNLQMSGNVSDESAKSIGKFLAADMVITGQLLDLDGMYRYRTSAINVETAVRASVTRLDVKSDAATRRMMAALANQKTTTKVAKYGVSEKATPQMAGTFLDRGIMFASRGEIEEALANFNEAIRLNPNMSAAYFNRGLVLSRTGEIEKALADYNEAIRLDPNVGLPYFFRAQIYGEIKKDYVKAIADMTQAIRLSPGTPVNYEYRSLMYRNIGDYAKAIEDLTTIIMAFDPRIADPFITRFSVYRGESYMALKDYDKAIDDFSRVIKLNPDSVRAYQGRAEAFILKREYDKAIADFNHILRLNPDAEAYYYRGFLYLLKEDADKAITDFEAALRLKPDYADARLGLYRARELRSRQ